MQTSARNGILRYKKSIDLVHGGFLFSTPFPALVFPLAFITGYRSFQVSVPTYTLQARFFPFSIIPREDRGHQRQHFESLRVASVGIQEGKKDVCNQSARYFVRLAMLNAGLRTPLRTGRHCYRWRISGVSAKLQSDARYSPQLVDLVNTETYQF